MAQNSRALAAGWIVAAGFALLGTAARADVVTLKNGMRLEGTPSPIGSMKSDPLKGEGVTDLKQILIVDNQLSRTFVPKRLANEIVEPPAINMERIPLFQRIPSSGNPISVVGRPIRIDSFDEYGHRIFSMVGAQGKPIELVQGITEITPRWTKVEAIQGINNYIWAMKIATSSIPREQLSKMLRNALDANNPDQRIRIVRLYMQSERYPDAREELKQVIKDFPALEHLKDTVKELNQLSAQRFLKEIELRRDAGQYRLASQMLEQFPAEGIAGEMLLKVREMLDELKMQQSQGKKTLKLIDENVTKLRSDAIRKQSERIITEIKAELNINNLDRFADFIRLADDDKMSAEQKLSLAISGWLLGSGSAIDNLEASLALITARDIARQYLVSARKNERDNLIGQIPSEVTIENMAKLVAHMKPPVETIIAPVPGVDVGNAAAVLGLPAGGKPTQPKPANTDDDASCAPKDEGSAVLKGTPKAVITEPKDEPKPQAAEPLMPADVAAPTAQATEIPGLYRMSVATNLSEAPVMHYWVQTPPEYDPYRRYPCIVTLNGAGTTPLQQMDWWAGDYRKEGEMRYGQATRHGYIVIAPEWTREHQRQYEFSVREHAAVLLPLRDACKRFAIDVDRVFLTGHSMGGTAAWDIGLSHPDLWAGLIPIVATPGRYITQYSENGKYLPMYFVCGEKDSGKWASAGDWDNYLKKIGYDVMIVEYLGRGHEAFFDEVQPLPGNLFAWLGLHKRDFFQKEFRVQSLRPWDNFFWWVETGEPKPISTILPAEWGEGDKPAKPPRAAETKTDTLAPNGVRVTSGSCGKVRVWLSPEIVTFDNSLKVEINGKPHRKKVVPSIETLLEDVRTRGDRQHPFWAKVEN